MNRQILEHHKKTYDDHVQKIIDAVEQKDWLLHSRLLKEENELNEEGIRIREMMGLAALDPCGNQRCVPRRYS